MAPNDSRRITLRKQIEKYEDAGFGSCWLRDRSIAQLVQTSLLHFDRAHYQLIAWCIMPNHMHAMLELKEGLSLSKVMHALKSYTAHGANKMLNRSGRFWFREYLDRYIRNDQHFSNTLEYIENNPVMAGLIHKREEWEWSSARARIR